MMKIILLLTVFLSAAACCFAQKADTLKINTTQIGADVIGFNGPTPIEISVHMGVITNIKALPNDETPAYLQLVLQSGLLEKLRGKPVKEAKKVRLDAVSGATYTSEALIENLKRGLENAGE